MELYFSISPVPDPARRDEILGAIAATVPGATAEFSIDGAKIRVRLPAGADRLSALDAITFRLLGLGFDAKELTYTPPQAPPITNVPLYHMQRKPRTVRLSVFIISLVAVALAVSILGFALGAVFMGIWGDGGTLGVDGTEDYSGKIGVVDSIFSEYALYDTNGDLLLDSMLKAYVAATGDQYAAYYTAEEFAEIISQNSGALVGIGITVVESLDPVGIAIIGVMPGSPAEAAGVLPGDVIVTIGSGENAFSVAERGYDSSLTALRGEVGSIANITVQRAGEQKSFSIARALVENVSVTGRVSEADATVGIVSISQFIINTPVQFEAEMEKLIAQGCTRFVFDVRNNPGGDLRSIVAVLSFFLNEDDLIVTTVYKDGTTESEYAKPISYEGDYAACSIAKEDIGKYRNYKKAVLINGNTASAAELFTAVLADYELATLIGTTTYGKGVLQNIFDLSPWGYTGGIKLTTGYYNPPSGENYDGKGITPKGGETPLDDAVKNKNLYLLTEAEDNQLRAAITAIQ